MLQESFEVIGSSSKIIVMFIKENIMDDRYFSDIVNLMNLMIYVVVIKFCNDVKFFLRIYDNMGFFCLIKYFLMLKYILDS